MCFVRAVVVAIGVVLMALPVLAGTLAPPTGTVVLTVTGRITVSNDPAGAVFDAPMLAALDRHTIVATTPWYDGPQTFEGPLFAAVLAAAGAEGSAVNVRAVNAYEALIPMADVTEHRVILATHVNGKTISLREKGPLFVIYPFDAEPDLNNEIYFSRSVWSVEAIEVR